MNNEIINPYSLKIGDILYSIDEDWNNKFDYDLKSVEITGFKLSKTETKVTTASSGQYFVLSENREYFERYIQGYRGDYSKVEGRWFVNKDFVKSELKRILQQKLDKVNKDIVDLVYKSREIKQEIEMLDFIIKKGGRE